MNLEPAWACIWESWVIFYLLGFWCWFWNLEPGCGTLHFAMVLVLYLPSSEFRRFCPEKNNFELATHFSCKTLEFDCKSSWIRFDSILISWSSWITMCRHHSSIYWSSYVGPTILFAIVGLGGQCRARPDTYCRLNWKSDPDLKHTHTQSVVLTRIKVMRWIRFELEMNFWEKDESTCLLLKGYMPKGRIKECRGECGAILYHAILLKRS